MSCLVTDRRQNKRVPIQGEAVFLIRGRKWSTAVIDISGDGLAVINPKHFNLLVGQDYDLELSCPPYFLRLPVRVVVTHCQGSRAGFRCVSISDRNRVVLKSAISTLLINEALIYDRNAKLCFA